MSDEKKTCRICGAPIRCSGYPGALPPDLCKPCGFDRIDIAKAILTGWCANPTVWPSSDLKFASAVVESAEFMLTESRKPKGES